MHIHAYVYVCACMRVYVHVYMYVYVYMHVCVCVCIYTYIHLRVGVHMHSCRRILFVCTDNPAWGDIFDCCFKAQSSKLERLFCEVSLKIAIRALSFEL